MTTVLVFSTGQTDVQLVKDGKRYELDKDCGSLHDELRRRTGQWRVVEATCDKARERAKELPPTDIVLCTPKLDAVLDYCEKNGFPSHALVLETQRRFKSDPRYAGEVVTTRMKERGVTNVERHVYLQGDERLEDPKVPDDCVIRREVIEKLDSFLAAKLDAIRPTRVVVATTGGIPNFNQLVDELVRLHGVGRFEVNTVEVPDGTQVGSVDAAIDMRFQPAAAYQARWHALSLIETGNLLGAWGAVQHLAKRESERSWLQVVEWLAHFASALPMPDGWNNDIPDLTHRRAAVRAALRVELALLAKDTPKAVHGTVAFLEAALSDHLMDKAERHPEERRLFKFHDAPPADAVRVVDESKVGELSNKQRKANKHRPLVFDHEDGGRWYYVDDGKVCAIQLARVVLRATAVGELAQVISVNDIRQIRNDAAHEDPTPDMMEEAHRRMAEAGLWSPGDHPSFLSQALIQDVLRELGIEAPEKLWENLRAEVRRRLVRPNVSA